MEAASESLLNALATRFGTQAIAIVVEPSGFMRNTSRDYDEAPFKGGAAIRTPSHQCTDAFGFAGFSGQRYMVTAGHCASNGGDIYTGRDFNYRLIGSVAPGSGENWLDGTGTVYLPGQSTYYGDLALIPTGSMIDAQMYRGGPSTDLPYPVKEKWNRESAVGDLFCTGGMVTGEQCGWTVRAVHAYACRNLLCTDAGRNVVNGDRALSAGCLVNGDSGGPAYTVRPDQGVAAKGVLSAAGAADVCKVSYTDIWDVNRAWPNMTLWIQ